jgi:hypothetical protein
VKISVIGQCETYIGTYSNKDLGSEIIARYRFVFKQVNPATILEDSGWIEKSDLKYTPKLDLADKTFNITLQVVTINGLELSSTAVINAIPSSTLITESTISQDNLAIENGYVIIPIPKDTTGYLKRQN